MFNTFFMIVIWRKHMFNHNLLIITCLIITWRTEIGITDWVLHILEFEDEIQTICESRCHI